MGISARIVKRIITLLIVILGVVTLSFCLQIFTGTDPAEMLVRKTTLFATEEQIQAMRVELGLDGTLSEQYADYFIGKEDYLPGTWVFQLPIESLSLIILEMPFLLHVC